MGQKTHPLGFRLGIVQEHQSVWYANFNQYASILEEDDKIRTYINTISRANYISKVKIYRNVLKDHIQNMPLCLVRRCMIYICNIHM